MEKIRIKVRNPREHREMFFYGCESPFKNNQYMSFSTKSPDDYRLYGYSIGNQFEPQKNSPIYFHIPKAIVQNGTIVEIWIGNSKQVSYTVSDIRQTDGESFSSKEMSEDIDNYAYLWVYIGLSGNILTASFFPKIYESMLNISCTCTVQYSHSYIFICIII